MSSFAVDPLDTTYRQSFHLNTIGVGVGAVTEYRQLMLANTAGIMPRNIRVGVANPLPATLMRSSNSYYDYLPDVRSIRTNLKVARNDDLPLAMHLNAMPWNDSADQSEDILHNFLEKYNGGELLQQDRFGRIRNASFAQDPSIDENPALPYSQMEMQLTLSPYAPLVQDYMMRDTQLTARYFAWLREESPDIVAFCTMSSEMGMNPHANFDFCDYSDWSKQEFRDWLSGASIYAGAGQYASLATFNAEFSGATGFPWASWPAVNPPINVLWDSTANGSWWQKWHEFRVAQVQHIEQRQMRAARKAGWSPDRLFGHQISATSAIGDLGYEKYAAPRTTTFVQEGGNGVTVSGDRTFDTQLYSELSANDKSWGFVEYNPRSDSVATNLSALNTVWEAMPHVICPYNWSVDFPIRDTAFQTALQQFIGEHQNDSYTGLAAYETAPDSRNVLWTMSYNDDIEAAPGLASLAFSNGICSASFGQDTASLSLQLEESRHTLVSDAYFAMGARLFLSNAPSGNATFEWTDTGDAVGSISIPIHQGWNLCRANLRGHAAWNGKNIKEIRLVLEGGTGNQLQLDWLQLEAGPCWNFDDTNEVYGVANFTGWTLTNGQFSGTSGSDGFFYLSTDKRSIGEDADRAFIDADVYKKVRVRLTSSANGTGQLYWWTGNSGPHMKAFPVTAGTHTYEVDMSTMADWSGLVTRFRLDPVNQNGVACSVDFVALSPQLLPPRSPFYDPIANSANPVFSWEPATEPDNAVPTYDFQLATDFGFTNILMETASQATARATYIGPELDGQHWWRVRTRTDGGKVSPWMVPLPLFARVWNGNSTNDFIGLHDLTPADSTNGIWTAEATGLDPYFELNAGYANSGFGINADLYPKLRIRMRVDAPGASGVAQFFFYPATGGTHSVDFTVPPDGQWHEQTIDLSVDPNWVGSISRVRVHPTAASNATISVDRVQFMPAANVYPATLFDMDGDFEGWSNLNNIADATVSNGVLKGTTTSVDPIVFNDSLYVDADQVQTVYVRLKSSQSGWSQFYWKTGEDYHFIPQYHAGGGEWSILVFDVGADTNWQGSINYLRIDPLSESGADFEIDWILTSNGDLDGDGIDDAIEGMADLDGDGLENFRDPDSDGDGTDDSRELYIGRDPYDVSDLAFHFDLDGDFEGWTNLNNIAGASVLNGFLTGTAESTDPVVFNDALQLDTAEIQTVYVRLKSSQQGWSQFYWKTDADYHHLDEYYAAADTWQVLSVEVGADLNWTGIVNYLRIDPSTSSNAVFSIDWIIASDGDLDDDGISDAAEGTDDLDSDGLENFRDPDSDGDGMGDADELLLGRNPYDVSDLAFHFNTDGDFEGWINLNNIMNPEVSGGSLNGMATSGDPVAFNDALSLDTDQVETIYVRMKSSQIGWSQFYWKTGSTYHFIAQYQSMANTWNILPFDVGGNTNWNGFVNFLRIDPTVASNVQFSIDWILASDGDLDNDGIADASEGLADLDGDGLENFRDPESDGDTLPDDWERTYGTNPLDPGDAELDSDGDGYTAVAEYIAGTDPTSAASHFYINSLSPSNGGWPVSISVEGKSGRFYSLLRSTNLVSGTWQVVTEIGPTETDGTVELIDTNETVSGMYKVNVTK